MAIHRALLAATMFAACGEPTDQAPGRDAGPTSCRDERDCAAPTPYCEPATGVCVPCRWSAHCATTGRVCEEQSCRPALTCAELELELPGLASGVYTIDIDGSGALEPFPAYCDLTTDGGGWTLVQRTRWVWSQSRALMTDYPTWHDMTIGMPEPGNVYRMAGTHWPTLAAGSGIMIVHRLRTTGGGACNPLYYVGSATFQVDLATTAATASSINQPVPILNSGALSTTTSGPDISCTASPNHAVPWFYAACCSTCPTFGGGYWSDEPHPMVSYTSTADRFGRTESNACSGQSIRMNDNGSSYRGVDSMEVYLR